MRLRLVAAAVAAAAAVPAPGAAQSPGLPESRHVLLGRSAEGRPIRAVRVGERDSPRRAVVVGAVHGNEAAGMRIVRALRERAGIEGVDLWLVDTANPDGVAQGTRGNSRGVDLNRNFPYRWRRSSRRSAYYSGSRALSERESRVMARWIERIQPAVTIWYHQPWGMVLAPCSGKAPVQRRYSELSGLRTGCRGAGLRGTASSWQNHTIAGSTAFVVELAAGGLSAKAARRHARAAALVAAGR